MILLRLYLFSQYIFDSTGPSFSLSIADFSDINRAGHLLVSWHDNVAPVLSSAWHATPHQIWVLWVVKIVWRQCDSEQLFDRKILSRGRYEDVTSPFSSYLSIHAAAIVTNLPRPGILVLPLSMVYPSPPLFHSPLHPFLVCLIKL